MSSIRLRGLSSHQEFIEVKKQIDQIIKPYIISSFGTALRSTFDWEATLTLENVRKQSEVLAILQNRLYDSFPHVQVDDDFSGIIVLACPNDTEPEVDVVAVHGLGGHATETWTHLSSNPRIWLRDFLPIDLPSARIMTFGYDSSIWSRSTAGIKDTAIQLLNSLGSKRCPEERRTRARPVVFLAHSLGGLVVKKALALSKYEGIHGAIHESTSCIAFFGTPHRGCTLAFWGNMLGNIISICKTMNMRNLDNLRKDSQALWDLSDQFLSLQRDNTITILSIYELQKTKPKFFRSVTVVDKKSAIMAVAKEHPIPFNADHRNVCRFSSRHDDAYSIIATNLKTLVIEPRSFVQKPAIPSIASSETTYLSHEQQLKVTFPLYLIPDPQFHGREEVLAEIQSHLVTHQRKISPAYVALVGTPGVGKTSLAKQFFHLEKQNCYYKYLFLIPADNRAKIYRAFTEIYQSLGLGATGAANTELVNELVLEHLAQIRKRWLIIYDNADESGLIQDYLPLEGDGSIIIVSRNKNIAEGLPKGTKTIHIKGLCDTEAQNLLLSRLNGGVHSERERELSRRIAQRFQCWPLALRQLSAFLEESETSMETMWSLLCQQTNIEGDIYSYKDSTSSYEFTLQASWSQILSTLQVPTIKLLNMLSLVDPDNIPSEIFSQGDSTGPPFPFTQFEYLSARAPLLKYDIVTKMEDGILSVHRLVQNTRLRMLHDDDRNEAFNAMLLILSHHFPKQALGDHMHALWGKCEVFLGSVLAFDTAVNQWQPRLDDPSSFLNLICDCTWYLWEIGQYEEALPRLASSEAFCASTIGLGSLEAARIYVNQGSVYSSLNRYGEAGPLFQKALDIRRVLLPQDHQLVVNSYMQVGNYLTWQGQCDDAVAAHEHVVRMRETYTTLSPGIAIISYLNLSRALLMAKRLAEATKAVDKAESWEEKLPNDTEKTYYGAHRLYIIGNIHLAGRKVVEALEAHQMAYQKRLESQATAYLIATSKHKIGIILAELGRIEEAIEFISDEITLLGSLPGNSKCKLTRLSRSEMKLANILLRSGLESASLDHRERAFKYYEEAFGVIIGDQLDLDFDTLVPPIDR